MRTKAGALALMLLASTTGALAMSESLRPMPRPDSANPERPEFAVVLRDAPGLRESMRPIVRPILSTRNAPAAAVIVVSSRSSSLTRSLRPYARPAAPKIQSAPVVKASAVAAVPTPKISRSRNGSVCGSRTIRGETIAPIVSRVKGCGIADPVRITSVDGVALSRPAIMNCTTANALESWVKTGVKPAVGRIGGGVVGLTVVADYSCRTRNNKPGAKISEHGKGHAVDISAINLKNGVSFTVLKGWRDPVQSKVLKKAHASACGPFGTVLGPNADRYHNDHFHLDTARHRNGAYCR